MKTSVALLFALLTFGAGLQQASAFSLSDLDIEKTETSERTGVGTASDTTFAGTEIGDDISVGGYSRTTVTGGYDDSTGRAQGTTSRGSREDTSIGVGLRFEFD